MSRFNTLANLNPNEVSKFWGELNSLAERQFRPIKFEEQVRLAMNTRASLAEMEDVHDTIKSYSDADTKEVEAWIPLQDTRARFHLAGIDTHTFSGAQKKGARTGTNVWDVINGLTHFFSHDNGFKIDDYDRRRGQVLAGKMLTKTFDMSNIVPSPFK